MLSVGVVALTALQALSATNAQAMEWSIDPSASRVAFQATAGGQTIRGSFSRFTAEIDFDPDAPESSRIRVAVDLSSVATGTAEVDNALPSQDWLNALQYPQATLRSTSVKFLGGDTYELRGDLRVRGTARPVVLPFTLHVDDSGQAVAEGSFTVNRANFGVGPAAPVASMTIDNSVQVTVKVSAQRQDN